LRTADKILEVQHLGKYFQSSTSGKVTALRDVSLRLSPGEFVTLVGPSGSGKSTLLNVLAGLEVPDQGGVDWGEQEKSVSVAYMQQKDLLLPWRTVLDNVLLGPEFDGPDAKRAAEPEARALLKRFHLDRFLQAYPAELSGGMRQRTALARTLMAGGELLLLDEPFGALDAITRLRLHEHLLEVWQDLRRTVLLVTHDVEEAVLLSTRVIVLSGRPGSIVAEVPIPIPHAQRRSSVEVLKLKNNILDLLRQHNGE